MQRSVPGEDDVKGGKDRATTGKSPGISARQACICAGKSHEVKSDVCTWLNNGKTFFGGINKLYSTQTPVEVFVMFCYNIIQRKNKSEQIKPCTGLASLESNNLPQLLLPSSSVPMKPWLPSEDSSLNQLSPIVCPVFPASRVTFTCTRNLGRRASTIFI